MNHQLLASRARLKSRCDTAAHPALTLNGLPRIITLSIADVVRLHTNQNYTVYMMGFTPGFPYMGKLREELVTPRLDSPRTFVRAGSVAIAGEQTGIYPIARPAVGE